MDVERRKQIVERLLKRSSEGAYSHAAAVKEKEKPEPGFIKEQVHAYVLDKLLLPPDETEENVRRLIEMNIERATNLDPAVVKELESASGCDYTSPMIGREANIRFQIMKDFEIKPSMDELIGAKTTSSLAELVYRLRSER